MLNRKLTRLAAGIALASVAASAQAGLKLKDEKSGIGVQIGGRLQVQTLFNDDDFKPNESTEFKVRRGRIRLGIDPHPMWSMFLQTEFRNDNATAGGNSGADVRMIDAFVTFKPDTLFQVIAGERMAPVTRQNLTSSGALMAWDRPGITNYNLTWGLKGNAALQNGTVAGTSAGSVGDVNVRDLGLTLFGAGDINDNTHFKYYLGVSEGSEVNQPADTDRWSARAQINFGAAESGYFNLSTYLGKKETIGIGIAVDTQDEIAVDTVTGQGVDYTLWTIDGFVEKPLGNGVLTAEAAWLDLDLDDANGLANASTPTTALGVTGKQTQGNGAYIQLGYLINNWQPFFLYETWDSDGVAGAGSWDGVRGGVTYYFKGHNANVKFAVENISNDAAGVADVTTAGIGFNITY